MSNKRHARGLVIPPLHAYLNERDAGVTWLPALQILTERLNR